MCVVSNVNLVSVNFQFSRNGSISIMHALHDDLALPTYSRVCVNMSSIGVLTRIL